MASAPLLAGSGHILPQETVWQKLHSFLLHRRVRITAVVFFVLLAEDVFEGHDPRNLINLGDYRVLLGLGLVFSGLTLRSWAAGTLHKRTQLATTGPYQLLRHPLYVGSFFMMMGFCFLVDDEENIWFVLGPILLLYVLRALHEEKTISRAFQDQWPAYAKAVPRFIPRRLPQEMFTNWNLSQWIHNREYQAVSAVLLGLVAVQAWHIIDS